MVNKINVSDYIVNFLENLGVRHVFLISGGGNIHLIDSIGKSKKIKYICNHHEQASAICAEAYSRYSGTLGVCIVTTGPGSTNTLTGLIGAWLDSIPVLFISGQIKRETIADYSKLRQLGDQEINIIDMVKPVTKFATTVMDPLTIRSVLEEAVHNATNGRPGPVWINIPLDVQGTNIDIDSLQAYKPKKISNTLLQRTLSDKVHNIIDKLIHAQRPVILVGNGVRLSGASREILHLIKLLKIPVLTSFTGYDLVGVDNPLFVGRPGTVGQRAANFTLQNSDFLLIIGCRLNIRMIGYNFISFARAAYKVMIDVDSAELEKKTIKIDYPVCSDARIFILEMIRYLTKFPITISRVNWWKYIKKMQKNYPSVLPEYWKQKDSVNVYCFLETLSRHLHRKSILALSDGTACVCEYQALKNPQGARVIVNSGCASMGYGLPAAIGCSFAADGGEVLCIEGDGSMQLNIQELQTIIHHKLPIKIFLYNNKGYASIRMTQKNLFNGRYIASDAENGVSLPDFKKVAKAYGIATEQIKNHHEMSRKIAEVLSYKGSILCEILLSPDQESLPKASSKKLPNGSFVSRPLEDMYPFLEREELKKNMIIPLLEEDS